MKWRHTEEQKKKMLPVKSEETGSGVEAQVADSSTTSGVLGVVGSIAAASTMHQNEINVKGQVKDENRNRVFMGNVKMERPF